MKLTESLNLRDYEIILLFYLQVNILFSAQQIQLSLISTRYIKTGEQLGDIFTKVLSGDRVSYLCNKLGMINIYAPT